MSHSWISKVTVTHEFDDGSISEYVIASGVAGNAPYVWLSERNGGAGGITEVVSLHPQSWPEIRDEIERAMARIWEEGEK